MTPAVDALDGDDMSVGELALMLVLVLVAVACRVLFERRESKS